MTAPYISVPSRRPCRRGRAIHNGSGRGLGGLGLGYGVQGKASSNFEGIFMASRSLKLDESAADARRAASGGGSVQCRGGDWCVITAEFIIMSIFRILLFKKQASYQTNTLIAFSQGIEMM